MLRIAKLKSGNILCSDDTHYTILNIHINDIKVPVLINGTVGAPKTIIPDSIFTYVGLKEIVCLKKSTRIFFGCLYDNQIVYVPQYIIKNFSKINKKG